MLSAATEATPLRKLLAAAVTLLAAMPVAAILSAPPVASDELPAVEATIVRDRWGVPHIYAQDAYSLFYANGYAQAQDRLAQMEILRHVGKGELASLTGPSGLELDLATRRELYTDAERQAAFDALDPYWRDAFVGYRDGVNRWIAEARADPAKLPVEYPALGVLPEDWSELDTIAIAQYLLDVFGRGSGGQEVENAKLLAQLGYDWPAFRDLVWVGVGRDTYTTIKPGDDASPFVAFAAEAATSTSDGAYDGDAVAAAVAAQPVDDVTVIGETPAPFFATASHAELAAVRERIAKYAVALAVDGLKWGSNAQLLDERFSESGKPLLYGGPQMGYFAPMIPYELGLHGAGFDATGMGIAGAPGVIIGRNANMSWTVTSGASDQVDTVAVRLTPGDPEAYYRDGDVLAMDCRTERHLVRPGPADFLPSADPDWRPPAFRVLDQRVCRLADGSPVLYRTPDAAWAFASQRSYRGDEVRSGSLWLQIGTIRSLADFERLFADFAFTFNFNFATEDGQIAYYHVGRQPLRQPDLDVRLPRDASDSATDWQGFAHLAQLPHVVDPASGYTVNWNNKPDRQWASGDARELWGAMQRAELMEETLLARIAADPNGRLTLDDLREVHERASTHEPYADDLGPAFRAAAVSLGATTAVYGIDEWGASGYDYADRDGDGFHDHAAFRLYEMWVDEMMARVFEDELGEFARRPRWDPGVDGADPHAADHGEHVHPFNVLVDALAGRTARAWCQGPDSPGGDCAEVAAAAMARALADDVWAQPLPARESKFTALGAEPGHRIPMTNRPSFQHFYDWGVAEGADRSRNALPPGGSGHMNGLDFVMMQFHDNGCEPCPLPPHQRDQLQMYVDFEDKPLLFARSAVEAHEESRIEL